MALIFTFTFGISYLYSQSKAINPIISTRSDGVTVSYITSIPTDIAKKINLAVKNYLNQDRTESVKDRNIRLSLFFSGSSPVYEYGTKVLSSLISKSTAEVTSISKSTAEGKDASYIVSVKLTLISSAKTETAEKTYWVSLVNTNDNSQTPYDIGENI